MYSLLAVVQHIVNSGVVVPDQMKMLQSILMGQQTATLRQD